VDPVAPPSRRRRRRLLRALVLVAALLVVMPLVVIEVAYQIEIARIPERPPDPAPSSLPPLVVRAFAVQLFDTADPQMTPIYPWTPLFALARLRRHAGRLTPEIVAARWTLALDASQVKDRRSNLWWAIDNWVLATWISRHLSAREAIAIALSETAFGQGTVGIGSAARHFLDKSAEDLDAGETALLLALSARPKLREQPDRLRESRDALLRKLHAHGVIDEPTMLAAMKHDIRRFK
jgi:hypothetical protein